MTYFDGDEFEAEGKTFVYTYTGADRCEGCDLADMTHCGCPDCACGFVWKEKETEDGEHPVQTPETDRNYGDSPMDFESDDEGGVISPSEETDEESVGYEGEED